MSRRLNTDQRRAQLIALGVDLFTRRPYDEVSIDDIAAQAGVSKGLLYHYFGGKRAYYLACIDVAAGELADSVVPDAQIAAGPERLRHGLGAYLDWVEERADAYLALMHGGMGRDPEVVALLDRTRDAILSSLWGQLGMEEVRPAFRVASRAWLGGVEAAAQDWLAHRDIPRSSLVDLLTVQLGVGLAMAASQDPEGAEGLELDDTVRMVAAGLAAGMGSDPR
ncbi:MAG: AcrR family transcriptional regulator [Myxococcota bacterium]|jgi:AcrR family transcriptional regulator